MFAALEYGPFGPVVGYGIAIIAAVGSLSFTWQRGLGKWKPPDEDLPNVAQRIVSILCGIGMIAIWYFAEPKTVPIILSVGIGLGVVCFGSFLVYSGMIGRYLFLRNEAANRKKSHRVKILGGRVLLPEAVEAMKTFGLTSVQDFFERAAYDPDKLWSRESRQWVKTRIIALFVVVLSSGTLALTSIGFVVQVILTGKPVATIVRTSDAPVRQEIVEFLARLNEELRKFENAIRQQADDKTGKKRDLEIKDAMIAAVKHTQDEVERFKTNKPLNTAEQAALENALNELENKKHSFESKQPVQAEIGNSEQPQNGDCVTNLSSASSFMSATGGSGSFGVSSSVNCSNWQATTLASWITVNYTRSGRTGDVYFTVAANLHPTSRQEKITVGGKQFVVMQSGNSSEKGAP